MPQGRVSELGTAKHAAVPTGITRELRLNLAFPWTVLAWQLVITRKTCVCMESNGSVMSQRAALPPPPTA